LVQFKNLKIQSVQTYTADPESEDGGTSSGGSTASGELAWVTLDNIDNLSGNDCMTGGKPGSPCHTTQAMKDDLIKIAAALKDQGVTLVIRDAIRPLAEQWATFKRNCPNGKGSCTTPTCMPRSETDGSNCAHPSGQAIDAWGGNSQYQQCIRKDACQKDLQKCANLPCQNAVIAAFRAQGFCRLNSEPWHFEKPPKSSNCN